MFGYVFKKSNVYLKTGINYAKKNDYYDSFGYYSNFVYYSTSEYRTYKGKAGLDVEAGYEYSFKNWGISVYFGYETINIDNITMRYANGLLTGISNNDINSNFLNVGINLHYYLAKHK